MSGPRRPLQYYEVEKIQKKFWSRTTSCEKTKTHPGNRPFRHQKTLITKPLKPTERLFVNFIGSVASRKCKSHDIIFGQYVYVCHLTETLYIRSDIFGKISDAFV